MKKMVAFWAAPLSLPANFQMSRDIASRHEADQLNPVTEKGYSIISRHETASAEILTDQRPSSDPVNHHGVDKVESDRDNNVDTINQKRLGSSEAH